MTSSLLMALNMAAKAAYLNVAAALYHVWPLRVWRNNNISPAMTGISM